MHPIDQVETYLQSVELAEKLKNSKIANIDHTTLSRRLRGVQQPQEAYRNNRRLLNNQQNEKLINWIHQLTDRGLLLTTTMLENFAQELSGEKPWKNWAGGWVMAHSDKLISRYSTDFDIERERDKCSSYFELLQQKLQQYDISPEQIYNMDEKGFMTGINTKPRLFSRHQYEEEGIKEYLQDGNREWITTIACVCADGTALSPGLIYMPKSGSLQESWLADFDAQKHHCLFTSSESGWMNEELGFQWLTRVFDKETKSRVSRGWRLLIVDRRSSCINLRFAEYCVSKRILLAALPAQTTHTLQPLDVALFGLLSQAYNKELERFISDSEEMGQLRKRNFFQLFWPSWENAFTNENIKSAFKSTGLHPLNPEIVLQRPPQTYETQPSPSKSTASILQARDWKRIRELFEEALTEFTDETVEKVNDTMISLSAEYILLKLQYYGLQNALRDEEEQLNRKEPLSLDLHTENEEGAMFSSSLKIQQSRDLQLGKDEEASPEKAYKEKKVQRAQTNQKKRKRREQEAEKKQRHKAKREFAKQADLQLHQDVLATPNPIQKPRKKRTKRISRQVKKIESSTARGEVNEVVTATSRRGRTIRLPERYR